MGSVPPRLRNWLDYEEPDTVDPRLPPGFRNLSINSAKYEGYEFEDDRQVFAVGPDLSPGRQSNSDVEFSGRSEHRYDTVADRDAFRLVILSPSTGEQPIKCQQPWGSS